MNEYSESTSSTLSVMDELRRLEEERDWLRYAVDGWSVWPLFRFPMAQRLSGWTFGRARNLTLLEQLVQSARGLFALARPRRFRLLAKVHSTARAEWTECGYKDVYFDDLLLRSSSYLKVEQVNNVRFLARSRQALVPSDMTDQIFRDLARLAVRMRLPMRPARDAAAALEREFSECFGEGIMSIHEILVPILFHHWLKKAYKLALRWWQPRAVLAQGEGEFALMTAARELGIPSVEFQHGYLDGRRHFMYSWSEYAKPYRSQIPKADVFFVYGKYWAELLRETGFWADEVRPVGSLRVDSYRRRPIEARSDERLKVLYTSTGVDQQEVTRFLLEALREWPVSPMPQLIIKLHPGYDTDRQPFIEETSKRSDVEIFLGDEDPSTFDLMRQADVHTSIGSTCHFEAVALGTPTIVLPFTGHDFILDMVNRGHAYFAATPEDLRNAILQASAQRVPEEVGEFYFRPNALENMLQALDRLIQGERA